MNRRRLFLTMIGFCIVITILGFIWYEQDRTFDHPQREIERAIVDYSRARETMVGVTDMANVTFAAKYQTKRVRSAGTLFYNRVGKCGSRSLLSLVASLAVRNHFSQGGSTIHNAERPDAIHRLEQVQKIAKFRQRKFYHSHIHYLDFKKLGYEPPIYINLVRDPVARFSSHYNYLKHGDHIGQVKHPSTDRVHINDCVMREVGACNSTTFMFYMGMYFCGFDPGCTSSSTERVSIAKKHIDEEYTLVGILEEFDQTLLLLEKMLPDYFEGVMEYWKKRRESAKVFSSKKLDVLTEESIEKLKNRLLADEYEVFNHVKRKFDGLKKQYGIS